MGKIFLVHDFSPSQPWVHAVLNSNKKLFASQRLDLAPFNPWTCELVPSHGLLWLPLVTDKTIDPTVRSIFRNVACSLENGKDALLFAHTPLLSGHQSFARLLFEETGVNLRNIEVLFVIGRSVLSLEQRYREELALSDITGEIYINAYSSIHNLFRQAREAYGNVAVIANLQDDPRTIPAPDIARAIFEFLGRKGHMPMAMPACHPLYYKSHVARQLIWLTQVRNNSWPRMDENEYAQTLLNMDDKWKTDIASPLEMRRKMHEAAACEITILEKELALAAGSLECPRWLLEEKERKSGQQLDINLINDFVQNLPEHIAKVLLLRYRNDERLLSENQKSLYSALYKNISPEIRHIGEVEPLVELNVLTMTYNHEEYIEDCLRSVLAQRTDFPVRHIVLDHCSSDSTAEIISSYAEKHPSIQPVLLSRRQPEENIRGLFERCSTKYVALCDGDDFFTSPLKLQKQVDYLENNTQCALCFHPVKVVFENGKAPFIFPPFTSLPKRKKYQYHLADLTKGNFIQTNSVVYRWRFRDGLPDWFRADICPSDWYWHMLHAEEGRIGFLPDIMSLYRRHGNALYAHAFQDTEAHFRDHGMAELRTYQVCNDHFKNRYFRNFSALANSVFVAFCNIAHDTKDSSLLDEATVTFPKFAVEFYRFVNSINKNLLNKKQPQTGNQ